MLVNSRASSLTRSCTGLGGSTHLIDLGQFAAVADAVNLAVMYRLRNGDFGTCT